MNLYDGYSSKNITWNYGYYMALYDDSVKKMNLYDGYSSKNIAWNYGYYMALYDDSVKK